MVINSQAYDTVSAISIANTENIILKDLLFTNNTSQKYALSFY